MRILLLSIAAFALAVLFGCKGQERTAATPDDRFGSATDSLFFSLQRTACFGKCPSYEVRVYRGGTATYEGRRFVEREGSYTGMVTPAMMEKLLHEAKEVGFFDLQDKYDNDVTDLPSTIIRVNAEGRDKQVLGRQGTPPAFRSFAAYADTLLEAVRWTKVAGPQH